MSNLRNLLFREKIPSIEKAKNIISHIKEAHNGNITDSNSEVDEDELTKKRLAKSILKRFGTLKTASISGFLDKRDISDPRKSEIQSSLEKNEFYTENRLFNLNNKPQRPNNRKQSFKFKYMPGKRLRIDSNEIRDIYCIVEDRESKLVNISNGHKDTNKIDLNQFKHFVKRALPNAINQLVKGEINYQQFKANVLRSENCEVLTIDDFKEKYGEEFLKEDKDFECFLKKVMNSKCRNKFESCSFEKSIIKDLPQKCIKSILSITNQNKANRQTKILAKNLRKQDHDIANNSRSSSLENKNKSNQDNLSCLDSYKNTKINKSNKPVNINKQNRSATLSRLDNQNKNSRNCFKVIPYIYLKELIGVTSVNVDTNIYLKRNRSVAQESIFRTYRPDYRKISVFECDFSRMKRIVDEQRELHFQR